MSMENKKTQDAYAQFAGILAPALGEQFRKAGCIAQELELAEAPEQPGTDRVAVPLRFEGALDGECFVACSAEAAALLAGDAGDPQLLLTSALQSAAEPFAAALFAHYGSVHVHVGEQVSLPEDVEAVAWLSCSTVGGLPVFIALHADGALERGLLRLARVAAAAEASGIKSGNLGLVMDVELNVTLRFGQRQLSLREVMDLASGSVVELDREVDEPVELILDGRVIARGEAVIVDGNYGVRVTEVLQPVAL